MFEITEFEPTTLGDGVAARVEMDDGSALVVSQLRGETHWVADGYFPAHRPWFPDYFNGSGSRCTMLKIVTDEAIVAALDALAAA